MNVLQIGNVFLSGMLYQICRYLFCVKFGESEHWKVWLYRYCVKQIWKVTFPVSRQ